jgi:hypothetical protein
MQRDILFIVIIAGLLIFGGIFIWRQNHYVSPEVFTKPTAMELGGRGLKNIVYYDSPTTTTAIAIPTTSTRKISITEGVRHSVDLERIVDGGPPKDGIPAIREPKFETVAEADVYLRGDGLGIGIDDGNTERFYPFQILAWHEIVNDVIAGVPVAITYCPLCGTAIVYERSINGVAEDFGVSGKLYDSNLLMYDKSTESYWSQALGEAIHGEMTGTILPLYQYFENITWDDWKKTHPNGEVLSKDTGFVRDYTREPYGNYAETSGLFFPVPNDDSRLPRKELVVGLIIDGIAKAYQVSLIEEIGEVTDVVNGQDILITKNDGEGIRGYKINNKGEKIKMPLKYSYWFSWAASYPTTLIFK